MKRFLEMVEYCQSNPVLGDYKYTRNQMAEYFAQCQPIVFTPTKGPDDEPDVLIEDSHCEVESAPFPIFCIEVLGQYITIPRPGDGRKVWVAALMCVEKAPTQFDFFLLCETDKGSKFVMQSHAMGEMAEAFLKRMRVQKVGVESVRERVKIGEGKEKRIHRIRKVIHVATKSEYETYQPGPGRNVEWTHRWMVRGHWVALGQGKLGKNREGKYCVEGFTWRVEHEKGPEGAPLITKVRVVEADATKT